MSDLALILGCPQDTDLVLSERLYNKLRGRSDSDARLVESCTAPGTYLDVLPASLPLFNGGEANSCRRASKIAEAVVGVRHPYAFYRSSDGPVPTPDPTSTSSWR